MNPDALNPPPPPPPPPGMTAARPFSPCAEPSYTERKHRTWVASPDATARHAFTTEPSWPDVSNPLPYQPQFKRSASITSYAPAPENPAGVPIGPGYVDRPSMSAVVRPACSIAARQPSSVSSSGSRNSRRPMSDWPTPEMHARRSMISFSSTTSLPPLGIRPEQRDIDVAFGIGVMLERDAQRHLDVRVLGRAVQEVGRQPHRRLLHDLDDRDDVRQLRSGHPWLVVDREGGERGAPRYRLGLEVLRVAARADRLRGMYVETTVLATPEPQLAARTSGPEIAIVIGELGQDAKRRRCLLHVGHGHSCSASRASSKPRRACGIASTAGNSP